MAHLGGAVRIVSCLGLQQGGSVSEEHPGTDARQRGEARNGLRIGWVWLAGLALALSGTAGAEAQTFELKSGDRVSLVGNMLAERMQHAGWLETLLHKRFPKHDLSFRNLGFSGDELTLRLRSADFGSPDEWLRRTKTDVVFAFFGYNESYGDEGKLAKFKEDLDGFIKLTLGQKYNGDTQPRMVLFSPIAHEDLKSPNRPDGAENNRRLKLYARAMAEVAAANKVPFVDLYEPSLKLYAASDAPLTSNGVHLNDAGDRRIAETIVRALFGEADLGDEKELERLRRAVLDKNFFWFNRYRTTDGYSIFGGRADLRFVNGQTNRVVMQREMEVLDAMTANRDRRVWAVAQGGELKVDDSNTPPFIDVITNKPGPLPGGKHIFLSGEGAIDKMTVAKNMKVNLFASEEMFPELINPVQMAFDTKGRLWVAAWPTYPHWKPKEAMNDKLLVLEDTNGDGKADRCTTFAADLHNPTGFEFWNGGVIVAMAPDLLFLKDTDGDGKADVRERLLGGLDSADTHHTSNSFTFDGGGALYFQEGTFHHSQVETPYGPPVRLANAGVFRFEPRSRKFDVYVSYGFANPHGHAFDKWGQDIVVDGTGSNPYHAALFSGHIEFPNKHAGPPQVYQQRTRPCPAIEYLSSKHFPEENQGNLLVGNVIGFQGILQYKVGDKGASLSAVEVDPIVYSSDANFRPADIEMGPDGAIYFTDWQNPIIGHMQHNLRDPSRDREHGRVYRVTYEGRPLTQAPKIAGEPIETLLALLKDSEARVRYRAKLELSGRETKEVVAALEKWVAGLNPADPEFQHHLLEALWVSSHHNVVNVALLDRVLASPDFRARAAAARVLCYWRDRISSSMDIFRKLANDEHPRVRLEAVRAASFYPVPEAVEIPIIAAQQPMDEYLEFVRKETMRTLDPIWKQALADGREIKFTTDAGAHFLLSSVSTERLLAMPKNRAVLLEMLYRPGLQDEQRRSAVQGLARLDEKPEIRVVLDAIAALDAKAQVEDPAIVFDLVRQLTGRNPAELAAARAELEKFALSARQPIFRQIGFVSLINVDRSVDKAWQLASQSTKTLLDLVEAMPLISDGSLRAALYPKIAPLLDGLPAHLAEGGDKRPRGRFVRIELPERGTLTLAEVEVMSDGRNVARQGRASQKNTGHGGDASRGIDGNKSGSYGAGGQTHTEEGTGRPWWEVDLGAEVPIDSIVIYNRTDDDLGQRLANFTLRVLDAQRSEVFKRERNPAPKPSVTIVGGAADAGMAARRAAMNALTYVRGQEGAAFAGIARFVKDETYRNAAIRALQRIPQADWPKEQAEPLLAAVRGYLTKLPAAQRTSAEAVDALEFAQALTALLPAEQGKAARAELAEIGVPVIRIGTLFERMSYDKDVLMVRAGKPVEFVFENTDLMPHNFVITQPGAMEAIGLKAEETATSPDAAQRHFVPASDKILLSSRLLQPRESQRLSFTAPKQPGVYPFVCTYPGHWRKMYGALYVVEDLDAYMAGGDVYLASHPLEIKDALLKDRRPRTEWKLEDLSDAVGGMTSGRSYGSGKQAFTVGACISCHRMDGVGVELGPDLTKLDPKYQPLDILKHILEPSSKIDEKYQQATFVLESGKTLTAMVLEETPSEVKVIENPLLKAEPVTLKKSEIASRVKSAVSIMPKGALDKLSREEILDLIAYLAARGNSKHPLVGGNHEHHH